MVRKKTDSFWLYVDECLNNRWKCKFCRNEYSGHVSRIKAHLGKVKNRGIDICEKVDETVKEEAFRALHEEAPATERRVAEETTQWIDQGIGFENDPLIHPSSNYDLLLPYQPGYDYSHYSAGEPSHPVAAENLSVPLENNEQNPDILHAQAQQVDSLPHSSFQQQNEVDQKLLTLKRKLKCLSNLKEKKEEELHQWSKKVKTTKKRYQEIKEVRSEGNHPSLEQLNQVKELINQAEELVIFATKNFSDCLELTNLVNLEIHGDKGFMVILGEGEYERYVTSNDGTPPITLALNIRRINISGCEEFQYLIGPGAGTRYYFPALREIVITDCPKFQTITACPLVLPRHSHAAFPCLESINISRCFGLKYLIEPGAETRYYFPALREIEITDCLLFQGITADPLEPPPLAYTAYPCLERINISGSVKFEYLIKPGVETRYHFPALREISISSCEFQGITADPLVLPRLAHAAFPCLERIIIFHCHEFKYLIGPGAETMYYFPALREIEITNCQQFQRITADPLVLPRLAHAAFPCLKSIKISSCDKLEEIIAISSSEMPHSASTLARTPTHFSHLTSLKILRCRKMKRLLNHDILPYLSNLQHIVVCDCPGIEELTDDLRTSNDGTSQITVALNLQTIKISDCEEFKYLIGPGAETRYHFPALRKIEITDCQQFQRITADPLVLPRLAHAAFPCLESINIEQCDELEEIIAISSSEMPHSASTLARTPTHFSRLTSLKILRCRKMKRLLNHDILPCLSNLERITVTDCAKMEELTSTYNEHTSDLRTASFLPNLKKLELVSLPELRSIGAKLLTCPIETIKVCDCPEIKRIPLQMEVLSNGATTPPSSLKEIVIREREIDWWETLEWESLAVKDALQRYLRKLKWK